jgi:hypothetical protein
MSVKLIRNVQKTPVRNEQSHQIQSSARLGVNVVNFPSQRECQKDTKAALSILNRAAQLNW